MSRKKDFLRFAHFNDVDRKKWPLEFFTPEEVADNHTGEVVLYLPFGLVMDAIRRRVNRPMIITSWYRNPARNAHVSTTGSSGPHTTGGAADVLAHHGHALDIQHAALEEGIRRIGVNGRGPWERRFVHLDMAPGFDEANWTYA
jgi:zinc D-Ala-D-Ala carboxypeptidase